MSTLSKSERQGLNDIFMVLDTKDSVPTRIKESMKYFLSVLLHYIKGR